MNGGAAKRTGATGVSSIAVVLAVTWTGLLLLPSCATVDVSFKTVTFEDASRERAFDVCRQVVTSYYSGTRIRIDEPGGRIETDPIESTIGGKAMRQQCYVQVAPLPDGKLEIALLARLQELEIESGAENPVRWVDAGSDVQVEALLLDEIAGRILALEIDAKVVSDTIPRVAPPR
jgi:hypothetical protein